MASALLRVGVIGASGRMGREVCAAVAGATDMELVAAIDSAGVAGEASGIGITADLEALVQARAAVVVDFTVADAAVGNVSWCLEKGIHCVVGTTGFTEEQLATLGSLAEAGPANVIVAPNFAIGAVLMMNFARKAASLLPDAEIVELHHDKKLDSPSGTSIKTADAILEGRRQNEGAAPAALPSQPEGVQTIGGARGASRDGVRIHSVRLPGLVAHQEVIFGGPGQTLSIRHDSIDRTSFMPGVLMAVREVDKRPGLTVGLESLLGL